MICTCCRNIFLKPSILAKVPNRVMWHAAAHSCLEHECTNLRKVPPVRGMHKVAVYDHANANNIFLDGFLGKRTLPLLVNNITWVGLQKSRGGSSCMWTSQGTSQVTSHHIMREGRMYLKDEMLISSSADKRVTGVSYCTSILQCCCARRAC